MEMPIYNQVSVKETDIIATLDLPEEEVVSPRVVLAFLLGMARGRYGYRDYEGDIEAKVIDNGDIKYTLYLESE